MTEWTYDRLCEEVARMAGADVHPSLLVVSADLARQMRRYETTYALCCADKVILGTKPGGLGEILMRGRKPGSAWSPPLLSVCEVPVLAVDGAEHPMLVWMYDGHPTRVEVLR